MKKLLVAILGAGSATVAFADSFQEFNNNVYAGYNNMSINEGQGGTSNSWTLGSTIQTKNNIWINVEANDSVYMSGGPYATYTYGTTMTALNQYYGLGVKPEYRFGPAKFSVDMTAYDLTQDAGGTNPAIGYNPAFAGQVANGTGTYSAQDFRYTINPEVQYDIAKTILVAGGYKYDQSFNNQLPNDGNSTVYVRVGYLF